MTQKKKQKWVALLLFVLGSTKLFSLVRELIVHNSATVFVKHGNDVTFHGNDLWIGVVTNGSLSLGFLLMGCFILLATNGSKSKHLPMVCLGVGLTSMFNFLGFYIFLSRKHKDICMVNRITRPGTIAPTGLDLRTACSGLCWRR